MEVRAAEIKSGAFIVLAIGVLTVLLFAVGNLKERFTPKQHFYAYLPDAKFLKPHDAVTFAGIRVGEIDRVEVSNERFGQVKVWITVDPAVEVREDSVLILKQDGMLGAKYLEISPGGSDSPRALAGHELKAEVIPAITDLSATIKEPLEKIDKLLEGLNRILNDPQNQKNIADILVETKELLHALQDEVHRVGDTVAATGKSTQDVMAEIEATIQDLRPEVQSILRNVDELVTRLNESADELTKLIKDADGVLLQNNRNIYETIRAVRDTAYHMEIAAKKIRANPSALLFGGGEETAEERKRKDEADLRLKGRSRRYDKENEK